MTEPKGRRTVSAGARAVSARKKRPAATEDATPRPRAMSLHIGLNAVNARHYGGWDGVLLGAENDATDLARLARRRGIEPTVLVTVQATRAKLLGAVRKAAAALKPGALFVLSFSGHGGQIPDVSGDEADRQDETWCLYDAQLIVKELLLELSRFAPGVRQLVIADTCHSGTITRAYPMAIVAGGLDSARPKMMPLAVALRTYRSNQSYYDGLEADLVRAIHAQAKVAPEQSHSIELLTESALTRQLSTQFAPALIIIKASQDNQVALDGPHGSLFTQTLLAALEKGPNWPMNRLMAQVISRMPATQSPAVAAMGPAHAFAARAPFTI